MYIMGKSRKYGEGAVVNAMRNIMHLKSGIADERFIIMVNRMDKFHFNMLKERTNAILSVRRTK